MGRDKANIRFRRKPLWQNQLALLRNLNPAEIFVSARVDPSWRPNDVRFVADASPSRGPVSGLAASLDRMKTSHLLALAIDMPWMSETYLESLCGRVEPGRGVVPMIAGRAEPLAAIYPQETAIEFRHALTGSDFSLRSLVHDLVAIGKLLPISVTEQEKRFFLNVNAPSDLPNEELIERIS
jgi:molybdopterin-guanine dinucleotide biosynthesis protein A